MKSYDVIVVGAGSNSLSAAAYLAKAGKSVLILEKNATCGGGVVSMSPAPGFILDPHAVCFGSCLANPAITHDELGLLSKFGLEFIYPGLNVATHFENGTGIKLHQDLDITCESIAAFSTRDADAYRRFVMQSRELLPMLMSGYFSPPLPFGDFMGMLDKSAVGKNLIGSMLESAHDLLERMFESQELKTHLFKFVGELMITPDTKGTAIVLHTLMGMMHTHKTAITVGGAKTLTDALVRCIEAYGGEVRTSAEVVKINVTSGKATGVTLLDGEVINSRDAVLANIHPWDLGDMIEGLDSGLVNKAKEVLLSDYGAINLMCALSEPPVYKTGPKFTHAVVNEFANSDTDLMRRFFDEFHYGKMPDHLSPLACVLSDFDPTRAPPGQASLYLYHFAPLANLKGGRRVKGGRDDWDEIKEKTADDVFEYFCSHTTNIDKSKVIARHVETPLDHHRHSKSMKHGDFFGCGSYTSQFMARRPIPELAQYKVPGLSGFYLVGPFMHPGGGVTLGGRAVAMRMLMDWKMDLKKAFIAF